MIMMKINRKAKAHFSLLLAMVLILGCCTSFAFAGSKLTDAKVNSAKEELKSAALSKIDSKVSNVLDSEKYTEVLVYLEDQVDTQKVANATKSAVSKAMTPYMTKLEVRKGVVESLKDKAESTQVDLLKYIEQEKEKGNVVEYTPYYIVNMVYVKATKEVIENISYMTEVKKIYKNNFIELEKPETLNVEPAAVEGLEWNIERVGANLVWDMGIDGTGAVVGLIDTGATWDHPALKEKWRGYDPATGATNPEGNWIDLINGRSLPYDEPSLPHGGHVLGTILGQEPDGSNKIGVAPGAKWIAAKAFSAEGGYDDDLITAGQWMLAPGGDPTKAPDVVNNSWGGGAVVDDWFRGVVNSWKAAGIVPVFAAGNQKTGEPAPWPGSIENPGNYPESFAVAATDKNNIRGSFSKLGPSLYDDKIIKPEISAPGVGIRSSVPGGGYEGGWSGTSMAAPHITGTVALLVSANSSLTVEDIEGIIEDNATPLTDGTYPNAPNFGYGYGLVNAFDAVSATTTGRGTIKGKVTSEGEDLGDPIIEHEQAVTEAFVGSDIEITANISDDVSIVEAELLVKQENKTYWLTIPMNRTSGDYKNGVYSATITYDLLQEPGFVYKIKARDYGGNVTVTDDYKVSVKFGIAPGEYKQGFENYPAGWIFDGAWEWGVPSGPSPAPFEGEKLAGTVLNGTYPSSTNSWLITPPIDLRDGNIESATLRFYEWYEMENNYDKGYVLITSDYGQTWTQVGPIRTGDGKAWKESVINLAPYAGSQDPVFVAFRLTSDSSGNKAGWYIDNVRIMGADNEPPAAPTGLTAQSGMTGIKLAWGKVPDGDLSHYNVYRSLTSGEGFESIAEPANNAFTDTTADAGITYYYKVAAVDLSGNISGFSEEVSAAMPEVLTIFSADFEENDGGFTTGTTAENNENPWQWGVPTSGPNGATSGEKLWATNLSGSYNKNTDAYIQSPAISLPVDKDPYLTFNHWVDIEGTTTLYDYGQVLISKDNGLTWTNITPTANGKYGKRVQAWTAEEISLSAFKGENVKLRFYFHSDGSVQYDGWYIDDVYVVGTESTPTLVKNGSKRDIMGKLSDKAEVKKSGYKDPEEAKFNLKKDKVNKYETINDGEIKATVDSIPMDAVVTVLETGKSVKTNPATGKYELRHASNEEGQKWTLRAEAYGYFPQEVKVHLDDEATVNQNFRLVEIPKGTIVGRVFDRYSNDPAANAVIRIKEDPRIAPVVADENGNFTIPNVYEGEYTLKVVADGFEPGEANITVLPGQDNEANIGLKRFVGHEEEISYDDGTAENALVLNASGNGLAVRMTPAQYGKVKAANIYFWDNSWPSPGGNGIGVAIFDTKANGDPGNMIGQPKFVTIERGKWNTIDLSEYGFATDRDFFIATVQNKDGTLCPGTGIDNSSPAPERSYLHVGGEDFTPIADEDIKGGLMIRAIMEYSVSTPEITNLKDINYTNQDKITVEGIVGADGIVNVYVNGVKANRVQTENRRFSTEVDLAEDETTIMLTAEMDGKETEPSTPVRVIKDKIAPTLEVTKPMDGEKLNVEVVHVIGNTADDHFDKLLINDKAVAIDQDGNFDERLIMNSGENTITVKASDIAGNETVVERKVFVKLDGPVLEDIHPTEDVRYVTGDTVTVSFKSETGGNGYFRIVPNVAVEGGEQTKVPMIESQETPGLYQGSWVVQEGFAIDNGIIEIEFTDAAGNRVEGVAPGKITINGTAPTEHKPMEELPVNAIIVGDEAYDTEYLNNNTGAQTKLVNWIQSGNEVYIKLNRTTIINLNGEPIDINILPSQLTYYDAAGNTTIYVKAQ
jgi:bacillopeptidase F